LYCNISGENIESYIRSVAHLIKHVHISDATGTSGEGVQIGEGEIDFARVLGAMERLDFSWVPEIWSGHLHHGAGVYKALLRLERFHHAL
jgi:N-acetylneuraminate synthase